MLESWTGVEDLLPESPAKNHMKELAMFLVDRDL